MTNLEKNLLIALTEFSVINKSLKYEVNSEILKLASALIINQESYLTNLLNKLKLEFNIIEEWKNAYEIIQIKLSNSLLIPDSDSIDSDLVKDKQVRRILLYKLYQLYRAENNKYTHYPLVQLADILKIKGNEIFQHVNYLHDLGYLNYGVADGGNCTSDITLSGIDLCENKELLFSEFSLVNINYGKDEDFDDNLETFNTSFVSLKRIQELSEIKSKSYDLTKLIQLLKELNNASEKMNVYSIAMLLRAVMDHIPPIFSCKNFGEVVNNYSWEKSKRILVERMENSLRNIADLFLHSQIKKSEIVPSSKQVDFRAELDVLLCEVISKLK